MARKRSTTLTAGELKLMRVLWTEGRATVNDVVGALPGSRRPAYNTVLTMLRILERKGYVKHEKLGRAFVYYPIIDRTRAQRSAVKRLVLELFDNSPGLLLMNVLEHDNVDADELVRLRQLLGEDLSLRNAD
ncbi:MAG: BlaI/MecI/CopY family transcriptional regulator [Vicinamibacterales bacterium]|jgi:predicted transcriptional regulator|nr:MarR family transcriptional regulator [Acidobacteriota bacterium]MDP7295232.1 BlaI/MecI/CopY family transcriptional regulator [Vicinamibacterales bacterium]MDP7672474.1 BlaI/MecI/CopY family transcriptional regulator [Vicinamibacterales bacterium]HJO37522.1 BlaI/MecI/CopY family transcriptional regulator [Vicinamibacterales bacterium]|tara:strand:+ start:2284 stop:2679 length:396 start_codon:yes stop_codon:yes gene_type:complete